MPSIEAEVVVEESAPASRSTIGIIYPPPEVRSHLNQLDFEGSKQSQDLEISLFPADIVDKTAIFVARNGQEFEARIYQNEIKNPKFNFLNPNDPYHNYYKHKVKDFSEGKIAEPNFAQKSGFGYQIQKPLPDPLLVTKDPPKEPPPEFEFVADPPSISAADLDVVKLTAQFVARNGRQFLVNLMNREQRNYQFDFLRPQHSLYPYFLKLIEQYTKILIPAKGLIAKLREEANGAKPLLDQAKIRLQWVEYQEKVKKREEEEKEKERIAYAQVDWHDFVVVETVDYQPNEIGNLPPPTTPDEVGARLLAQERYEQGHVDEVAEEMDGDDEPTGRADSDVEPGDDEGEEEAEDEEQQEPRRARTAPTPSSGADTRVQDMEEDSDAESEDEDGVRRPSSPKDNHPHKTEDPIFAPLPPLPPMPPKDGPTQLPPLPPNPDQVLIRRDYNPKAPKPTEPVVAPDQFLVSPITGEKIPADKIQEHMRIGLLDPKWIEQRDRAIQERREQEEVYAPGSAIGSSLRQLAERRTDIFGSGIEETQIGKKIGEEEKKEKSKVIWDGHTASMEKVAQKARENITIEDQIAVIHKTKGLLPDEEKEKIGPAMPKMSGGMQIPPPQPPKITQPPLPPSARPPMPPQSMSVPSSSAPPVSRPPAPPSQPMRPVAALPPRPPMVGGMMTVGGMPVQSGVVMVPPPPQGMVGPGGIMGMRPPMPPSAQGARPPFMSGPPMMPQMGQPMPPPMPRPPMPTQQRPGDEDEPPSKKARSEEQLIPENDFLAMHKGGPVTFRVQVPNAMDKSEWKLSGQIFTITLPLTDTVSVIKAKMFDELGMPAGKQKLQLDGMFMKDSNSLAFYNFTPMCIVQLQVKERGGRKK